MVSVHPCLVPDCNVEYSYNTSHIHQIATKRQTNGEYNMDFFRAEKKEFENHFFLLLLQYLLSNTLRSVYTPTGHIRKR